MPPDDSFEPADLSRVRRYSIRQRANRTETGAFGSAIEPGGGVTEFLASLPKFLKAADFNAFIQLTADARRDDRPFHLLLGAHTIKVGLTPILIDLLQRRIVTGVSFNGAGVIHELELAFFGGTSEDVLAGLADGSFGMAEETGRLFGAVVNLAAERQIGLGEAAGRYILENEAPYKAHSLFAAARELDLPVTIHAGIGTDIVAQHPEFDGAKVGAASHRDFRLLAEVCARLDRGGVVANIGSAVILPEVFLKALTVARNLHPGESRLTTANFDMLDHYRPRVNVVTRPTAGTGKGFTFIGHHEIMIPLLAWGLKARLGS